MIQNPLVSRSNIGRRHQVEHTGGTFTMESSAEKTEACPRPTVVKRLYTHTVGLLHIDSNNSNNTNNNNNNNNNNNSNNNSGFLYNAQVCHTVTLMALQHYTWSLGLKSFLKPSQLPGEYTVCAAKYVSQSRLINHKNQLCPRRYPFTPWWREAYG